MKIQNSVSGQRDGAGRGRGGGGGGGVCRGAALSRTPGTRGWLFHTLCLHSPLEERREGGKGRGETRESRPAESQAHGHLSSHLYIIHSLTDSANGASSHPPSE